VTRRISQKPETRSQKKRRRQKLKARSQKKDQKQNQRGLNSQSAERATEGTQDCRQPALLSLLLTFLLASGFRLLASPFLLASGFWLLACLLPGFWLAF
jgi:Flp pilus assembly protein TadB